MPSLTAPRTACGPRRSLAVVPSILSRVLRRGYGEATGGLPPYPWEWAGRVVVGEGPGADPNLGWSD
jgi:hypothetical protein